MFFITSSNWVIFPLASLTATIFSKSRAKRNVVSALMLTPVRPGTLYNTTGTGEASAMALKCWYNPSCEGLL